LNALCRKGDVSRQSIERCGNFRVPYSPTTIPISAMKRKIPSARPSFHNTTTRFFESLDIADLLFQFNHA